MKNTKLFFALFAIIAFNSTVFAQNSHISGNAVVSEVKVYDEGNGNGNIEVRISGNNASTITSSSLTISGDRIPGGTTSILISGGRVVPKGPGNEEVILSGSFPLLPSVGGNGPDFVNVDVEVQGLNSLMRTRFNSVTIFRANVNTIN